MNRAERIGDEMRRQISELILRDIKDPRLPRMTSVTRVRVTRDLSRATIYVSVFGSDDDKQSAITALTSALGFIRREIGKRMRLRIVPELQIELDDSIEEGFRMDRLIDEVLARDARNSQ